MPTKQELQDKSEHKLNIIKGHFVRKEYDDVVENSGYVIEFGLKAAVCKNLQIEVFPEERKYYTHDLSKLLTCADLQQSFNEKKIMSQNFFINWSILTKWSPEFRYQPIGSNTRTYAKQILNAINHESEGVFPWVKKNW